MRPSFETPGKRSGWICDRPSTEGTTHTAFACLPTARPRNRLIVGLRLDNLPPANYRGLYVGRWHMSRLSFLWEVVQEVAESAIVLGVGIVAPLGLLSIAWGALDILPTILTVANEKSKFSEILLILIPLGLFYLLTGFLFAYRTDRRPSLRRSMFTICFFVPITSLCFCQGVMMYYLVAHKESVLQPGEYGRAIFFVGLHILCLFMADAYMTICRVAGTKAPPRRSAAVKVLKRNLTDSGQRDATS